MASAPTTTIEDTGSERAERVTDLIDRTASALCAELTATTAELYSGGDTPPGAAEMSVRWSLVALLLEAEVVHQVVARSAGLTTMTSDKVADSLYQLLTSQIVEPQVRKSWFDVAACASGASLCGWARAMGKAALPSEIQKAIRTANRTVPLREAGVDDATWATTRSTPNTQLADIADTVTSHIAGVDPAEAEHEFKVRTFGRHGCTEHEAARAVARTLGTPMPTRLGHSPSHPHHRALLVLTDGNHDRELAAAVRYMCGDTTGPLVSRQVLAALLKATDGWTAAELDRLADCDFAFKRALLRGAIAPVPKSSGEAVERLATSIKDLCNAPGWTSLAGRLAKSYASASATRRGVFPGHGQVDKTATEIAEDRAEFRRIAERALAVAARHGVQPFRSDTPRGVYDEVAAMCDTIVTDLGREQEAARLASHP